jgi:hypothetical protein
MRNKLKELDKSAGKETVKSKGSIKKNRFYYETK